jgi:hypothetical protein
MYFQAWLIGLCIAKSLPSVQGSSEDNDAYFSGVYAPDVLKYREWYAGAYLIPKRSFLSKKAAIEGIVALEQGTGSIIVDLHDHGSPQSCRQIVMTRDYFDFMVEHLSAFTNTLEGDESHPAGIQILSCDAYRFTIQMLRSAEKCYP